MPKYSKFLPFVVVFLSACHQGRTNTVGLASDAQTMAQREGPGSSVPKLICDTKTAERADKLNRYALGSFKNGVMTQAESESLQKLSSELLACAKKMLRVPEITAATENLQKVKLQANAGVATRQMVLQAQQKLIDATFCENSFNTINEIELILQKEADVGVRSIADFIPVLKDRLVLSNICIR